MNKLQRLPLAAAAMLFGALHIAGPGTVAAYGAVTILEPVTTETGEPMAARAGLQGGEQRYPILRVAAPDELTQELEAEFQTPFLRLVSELDAISRSVVPDGSGCAVLDETPVLYLSREDGGFARRGLWLRQDDGSDIFCDASFVDMTVSGRDIADGGFAEIFAHEMGHVFLRRLMGPLPPSATGKFHNVFTLTDPVTAFDEGFGIHFQTLAALLMDKPSHAAKLEGRDTPRLSAFWFSNAERRARLHGVMENRFVHERMQGQAGDGAYWPQELSAGFDYTRLRNGQQMMASEGVLATLFYRLATLGLEGQRAAGMKPALKAHFTRLFTALHRVAWTGAESGVSPYLALLKVLAQDSPEAGRAAAGSFVLTTYGATVDPAVAVQVEKVAVAGLSGQIGAFMQGYQSTQKALEALAAAGAGEGDLAAGMGQPIWLLASAVTLPSAPWGGQEHAFSVNLNTATVADLIFSKACSPAEAEAIVASRRAAGYFASLDDLFARVRLRQESVKAFTAMERDFAAYEGAVRE